MHVLWLMVADASKNMQKGDSATVLLPAMEQKLSNPNFLTKLMGHLDACKDVCDNFGVTTILVPYYAQPGQQSQRVIGFTVKSYRNPNALGSYSTATDASEMKFAPDPFWDDDEEWDFSGLDDDDDDYNNFGMKDLPEIEDLSPKDDSVIVDISKKWVEKMMADLALCPFTQNAERSGIPLGPVHYQVDRVTTMEDAYAAYWSEVCRIENVGQNEISTTLQILPEFCMNYVEIFEQWADTLTGTLEALEVEELLQLIFFHPHWTFRDGGDRSGSGLAANYARRSPWPMVNILRTKQVRTAQKGIPTGLVYQQNEKTLGRIGMEKLEKMLRLRDWSDVEGMKVDRKDMEALRVAQDLQVEGAVRDEDTSFMFDSTPAANKVDRSQIDGGDMVNVIRQALEMRLGKTDSNNEVKLLDGAQTSAAMMASDFLLEELRRIETEYPGDSRAPILGGDLRSQASMYASQFETDDNDDYRVSAEEDNSLWGGGIPMTSDDGEVNANNLYRDW